MGYESAIIIGYKTQVCSIGGREYCHEISRFRLGKVGTMSCFVEESGYYFYDGDKEIFKDDYGDNITMCSLDDLMGWINHQKELKEYLTPLKSYVKALMKSENQNDIVVLHYGY